LHHLDGAASPPPSPPSSFQDDGDGVGVQPPGTRNLEAAHKKEPTTIG